MSTTTALTPPDQHSTIDALEAWVAARKAQVQKGAELLIAFTTTAEADLSSIQANDPIAAAAISLAVKKGIELGLPEAQISTLGQDIIATAQAIAGPNLAPAAAPVESVAVPTVEHDPA